MTTTVTERTSVRPSDDQAQGIVDDLRETLEADEIVARNLEVVVDEGDP